MKDFIRFTERVNLDVKGRIKDFESGVIPPAPVQSLPSDNGNGVYAKIAATHAGIITLNNGMYLPDRMKDGVGTFTQNYGKPMLVHHDQDKDAIGRVVAARYVDTSNSIRDKLAKVMITDSVGKEVGYLSATHIADFVSGNMTDEMKFNTAVALMSDSVTDDMDYAGLGYAEVIAYISDMDAAQKFEDGRYLTVSIGVMTDKAICSICKQDLVKDGPCEHIPGREYDGRKAFLVTGNLHYEELSAVNVPADPHASVISLSRNGFTDSLQVENDKDGSFCTGIFCFTDSCSFEQKEKNMKKSDKHDEQKFDLASLLKAESVSAEDKANSFAALIAAIKDGVEAEKITVEDMAAIEATDLSVLPSVAFCDAHGLLPVHDDAFAFASRVLVDALEDEELKAELVATIETKAEVRNSVADAKENEAAEGKKDKEENKEGEKKEDEEGTSEENKDSRSTISVMHNILGLLAEDIHWGDKDLTEEELGMLTSILTRLAPMAAEDSIDGILTDANIVLPSVAERDKKIINLEAQNADISDKLSKVAKEYAQLFDEVKVVTKRYVDEKMASRKAHEEHLQVLRALDGKVEEETDFSLMTDSAIKNEISRYTESVDMKKIVAKLSDGMSRVPSGSVDDPTATEDSGSDESKFVSLDELRELEAQYIAMKFVNSGMADAYRVRVIDQWRREGRQLPEAPASAVSEGGEK